MTLISNADPHTKAACMAVSGLPDLSEICAWGRVGGREPLSREKQRLSQLSSGKAHRRNSQSAIQQSEEGAKKGRA